MHSPSLLTPLVANAVISDHAEAARVNRSIPRRPRAAARILGRRSGASPRLVPRGRTVPPLAH